MDERIQYDTCLGCHAAAKRDDGVDRRPVDARLGKNWDEAAGLDMGLRDVIDDLGNTEPIDRGIREGLAIREDDGRRNSDLADGRSIEHEPGAQLSGRAAENDGILLQEVRDIIHRAFAFEIGRRGIEAKSEVAKLADSHFAVGRKNADANDNVPSLCDGIGHAIRQGEVERNLGMLHPERCKCRQEQPTEACGQIDTDAPNRLGASCSKSLFRTLQAFERDLRRLKIYLAIFRQADRPRRALQQLNAETRLQALDGFADVRLAARQMFRRLCEAAGLRYRRKSGDLSYRDI
ncbi:MAG TPA: hypothetical protein VM639_13940 [Dongiaceae bacterium]|nr:hypothetical protein [Dongiaceae bacterium]